MRTQATYGLCRGEVIPPDEQAYYFEVREGPIALAYATVMLIADTDEGYYETNALILSVEVSHGVDGPWVPTTIHDLTAVPQAPYEPEDMIAGEKWVQAEALTFTEDIAQLVAGIANPAPYVRVVLTNTGDAAVTASMWLYASR